MQKQIKNHYKVINGIRERVFSTIILPTKIYAKRKKRIAMQKLSRKINRK